MDHHGANGPSVPGRWWGPTTTTVANADVMNQLCRVCGEPAAGFHFGAFTCEGCKSFFGRTYNNLSSVSECKNNGECIINKKNRTSCKACRLRKCLRVGMSKSGSRYGRRSNWFKIHCLLQEQQHHHHTQISSTSSSTTNLVTPPKPQPPPWMFGPTKDSATLLDVDNNNTLPFGFSESKNNNSSSPGFLHLSNSSILKPPDPESSFWNSRHANFLTVPPPHTLSPFFISPFFQNTLHPSAPPNYLLPFLPITSSSALPLERLPISPTNSLHSVSPSISTISVKKEEENNLECSEKFDNCLGPVQEQPIDLTTCKKKSENNRRNSKDSDSESSIANYSEANQKLNRSASKGQQNVIKTEEINSKISNPLDLSRLTS